MAEQVTVRELLEALEVARPLAEGGDRQAQIDVAEMEKALKNEEYTETSNNALSLARGVGKGTTLGFDDEIMAISAAATQELLGPGEGDVGTGNADYRLGQFNEGTMRRPDVNRPDRSWFDRFLENYDTSLESIRGDQAVAAAEDPWLTFTGELAGGMLTGGRGAAKAVAGKTLRTGIKEAAKTGAKYGAAAGYGYSEGDPIRASFDNDYDKLIDEAMQAGSDTLVGGSAGAILGAALPAAAAGGRKAMAWALAKIDPKTKQIILSNKAKDALIRAYQDDVADGLIDPDTAARELAEVPGMILPDVGKAGSNLRKEMERVAQIPSAGGRKLRGFLEERNKAQLSDIYPKLSKLMTGQENHHFARIWRDITNANKKEADKLYRAVEDVPAELTNRMRNILKNPMTKSILKEVNEYRAIHGKPPIDPKRLLAADDITTDELDSIIRGFDGRVNAMFKPSSTKSKQIAAEFKSMLAQPFKQDAFANGRNAGLGAARRFWRGHREIEEAAELGENIFKQDYELAELALEGFSESEKDAFRMGLTKAYRNLLETRPWDADLTKAIKGNARKEKLLEVAFDGKPNELKNFLDYIGSMEKMFLSLKDGTRGSQTLERLIQQQPDFAGEAIEQFSYNAGLGRTNQQPVGIGPRLSAWVGEQFNKLVHNPEAAKASIRTLNDLQADILMTNNLKNLQRQTMAGILDVGIPESAVIGTRGILATGAPHEPEKYRGR